MGIPIFQPIWRDSRLGSSDKLVALAIADHVNAESGTAWPSVKTLVSHTSLSRRTVQECLRRLEALGIIATEINAARGGSNRYSFSRGATDAPPAQPPRPPRAVAAPPPAQPPRPPSAVAAHEHLMNTYDEHLGKESVSDIAAAVAAWREMADRAGLPKTIDPISEKRKKAIAARLRDLGGLEGWRDFVAQVEASDFLTGKVQGRDGKRPFRATLDWVTNPSNMTKVREGNYDNADSTHHKQQDGPERMAGIAGAVARRRLRAV